MRYILSIFLVLLGLKKIFLLTPIWNLKTTADDLLLNKDTTTILLSEGGHKSVADDNTLILEKQITRKDNRIIQKNYYKIDNFDKKETLWEDIESFYQILAYFVCPKGPFYLTQYIDGTLYERKPFDISGKWELLCYRIVSNVNVMFTFYLNSKLTKLYYYKYWVGFGNEIEINRSFLDMMWLTTPINNIEFPMIAITLKDNKIYISKLLFYLVNDNNISYKDIKHIELNDDLSFSEAYFYKSRIFWISYDETHFISGFSENQINGGVTGDISEYILRKNTKSPFEFLDNITIKSIKFIRNTKYIYYNIITNSNNKNYIGVIDIEFNRVIYNVENVFKEVKPYSNRGLLLETDSTMYRECFSGKDKNNNCYLECPSGQILVLDNINSNYCAEESSEDYYILKPDDIPIANCNESLYVIQNINECGLCKDLNIDKQYKIINESECREKPENTYFIYEELKILKYCHESCKSCFDEKENSCTSCYIGYKLVNGKCVEMDCYPSCKVCDEESNDENNQHCLSCQINKFLQEDNNNCIDNCLDGYYEDNTYCKKCHESCLTCEKGGSDATPNCGSCKDNKYLIEDNLKCTDICGINYYINETEKICYRCSDNCEKCSRGSIEGNNFCLTCDQNSKFKFLLNIVNQSNCVEQCPNTTILNETINQCIEIKNKENDTNKNNNNDNNKIIIIIILLIIILLIFILIICIICKRCNNKKGKVDSNLIDNINNELKDNNMLY